LEVQVNRSAWDQLPQEYQEIFKTAAMEANLNMLAKYDALNGAALQRLIEGGTELKVYSTEIMQAAQKAAFALYEENASEEPAFKEIYDQWKQFREQVTQWNQINELSFSRFISNSSS